MFRMPWSKPAAPVDLPRERFDWEDWAMWMISPPPKDVLVVAMRREWAHPHVFYPRDTAPEMNVWGLHWKPWTGRTINAAPTIDSGEAIETGTGSTPKGQERDGEAGAPRE